MPARRLLVVVTAACALTSTGCCDIVGQSCGSARLVFAGTEPKRVIAGEPVKIGVILSASKAATSLKQPVHFDFDDDGTSDQAATSQSGVAVDVEHAFPDPGSYRIRFTTTVELKDVTVRAVGAARITVAAPRARGIPVASIAAPTAAYVGQEVRFDASASTDPDGGRLVGYRWTFGDGSGAQQETGPVAMHIYTRPGRRHVRLEVIDDEGTASSPYRHYIEILPSASAATLAAATPSVFSARLTGLRLGPLPAERGTGRRRTQRGVRVRGQFRGRLRGQVRPREGTLRRLLHASWRARLDTTLDLRSASATARGLALATIRGRDGGRACLRLRIRQPAFGPARGTMSVVGGTGAAASLRANARFTATTGPSGALRLTGRVRARHGRPRALTRACLATTTRSRTR